MNLNELRRKRNAAVKSRNNSKKSGTYLRRQIKRTMQSKNKAGVARSKVSMSLSQLRTKAKKLGINTRVKTMFGYRNKTLRELQNNLRRARHL
jgi:hypothetical protein